MRLSAGCRRVPGADAQAENPLSMRYVPDPWRVSAGTIGSVRTSCGLLSYNVTPLQAYSYRVKVLYGLLALSLFPAHIRDTITSRSYLLFKRRPDRYDVCAGAIILSGTLIRLVFILLGWSASYNDEGTLGLMALHIAYKGAHPLLYYGQDYLGSLEAYLGAGFFRLFGASTPTLRLGLLLLFALFLISIYILTSLLYSKSLALITLIFLSLGSPDVLLRQLMAAGGTPELMLFTTLLLLLTSWLALTASTTPHTSYKEGDSGHILPVRQRPA